MSFDGKIVVYRLGHAATLPMRFEPRPLLGHEEVAVVDARKTDSMQGRFLPTTGLLLATVSGCVATQRRDLAAAVHPNGQGAVQGDVQVVRYLVRRGLRPGAPRGGSQPSGRAGGRWRSCWRPVSVSTKTVASR